MEAEIIEVLHQLQQVLHYIYSNKDYKCVNGDWLNCWTQTEWQRSVKQCYKTPCSERSGYQLIAEALKTYKGLLFYQLHGSVGYITFSIQQKHLIEYWRPLWKKSWCVYMPCFNQHGSLITWTNNTDHGTDGLPISTHSTAFAFINCHVRTYVYCQRDVNDSAWLTMPTQLWINLPSFPCRIQRNSHRAFTGSDRVLLQSFTWLCVPSSKWQIHRHSMSATLVICRKANPPKPRSILQPV